MEEITMRQLLFLGVLACLGACRVDVEEDGDGVDIEPIDPVERTCTNYCERQAECDDEVNTEDCVDDCVDTAGNCQADEQEQALAELDECAEETCDDIGECTVGASLECYLGI
jgi:hypothetical protein